MSTKEDQKKLNQAPDIAQWLRIVSDAGLPDKVKVSRNRSRGSNYRNFKDSNAISFHCDGPIENCIFALGRQIDC